MNKFAWAMVTLMVLGLLTTINIGVYLDMVSRRTVDVKIQEQTITIHSSPISDDLEQKINAIISALGVK